MVRSFAVAVGAAVVFFADVAGADCFPHCGYDLCPPAGAAKVYLATVTDVSAQAEKLQVVDTFGSFGVNEGDEIHVHSEGAALGDRYLVVVDVNYRPVKMRVDKAGVVRVCAESATLPVERAAAIALASSCSAEAKKEGLEAECHDGGGCSAGGGGPALLTAGAAAALFAALRSRRRAIA